MRRFHKPTWKCFTVAAAFVLLIGQDAALSDEDISHSIARLDEIISSTSSNKAKVALLLSRSNLNRLQQNWPQALGDLDTAIALNPSLEDRALRKGLTFLEAGRPAEAVDALERHLSVRPNDDYAWIQLARAMVMLRLYDRACEAFSRAIALSQHPSPELILERADAIQALGPAHFAAALNSIESGIAIVGPAISLELRALRLEQDLGRFDRALLRVSVLTDRAQSKAPWLLRKGGLLLSAGRRGDARRTLEDAKTHLLESPRARRETRLNKGLLVAIEDLLVATKE